jgi:hypothetical protein
VETRAAHEFIGFVGLHIPTPELPFSPCVEIGWRLAAEHWGNGYATEAARSVLRVGFQKLGLHEIVSFTAVAKALVYPEFGHQIPVEERNKEIDPFIDNVLGQGAGK